VTQASLPPRDTGSRKTPQVAVGRGCHYCLAAELVMPIRLKKLIGTVLLIILVIVYALLATMIAVAQLAESGPLVHLAFFFFSGLLWVLPAMAIIKWMMISPRS
jgi:hypothetical protein